MQPISGSKIVQLKKELNDLKRTLKKANDDKEIRKVKKRIMEKEAYLGILTDKMKQS